MSRRPAAPVTFAPDWDAMATEIVTLRLEEPVLIVRIGLSFFIVGSKSARFCWRHHNTATPFLSGPFQK